MSEKVKRGYKRTEVGVIPEDWKIACLGDLATTVASGRSIVCRQFGNYPVHGSTGVIAHTDKPDYESDAILVARVGANAGKLNIVSGKYGVTDNTIIIRMDSCSCLNFFFRQLESRHLNNLVFGSGQPLITGTQLKGLALSIPPLPEQRAIAEALSDVDALLTSLDQLIAKKRDLKQAAMQQLHTGKKRLPGFDGEWEVCTFGEIAKPRARRINPKVDGNSDFCVELEHIASKTGQLIGSTVTNYESSLKTKFCSSDVLFGKLRAYLRKFWLADKDGVCSTEIWALAAHQVRCTPAFLFQLVQLDSFIEVASTAYGTHMPRSDWNLVKNYEINLPVIQEQTAIAEVLSDMDSEITALEQKRDKTRSLKQGMMQELLTGKTRLMH
jgi:type I restriction enzyme, S subunit